MCSFFTKFIRLAKVSTSFINFAISGGTCLLSQANLTALTFPAAGTFKLDMQDNVIDRAILDDYSIKANTAVIVTNAVTLTYVSAQAWELDLAAATGNVTVTIAGGPISGDYGEMLIKIKQDTSPRTITWSGATNFFWPGGVQPTLSAASGAFDIFHIGTWDGGTTWWGSVIQDMK